MKSLFYQILFCLMFVIVGCGDKHSLGYDDYVPVIKPIVHDDTDKKVPDNRDTFNITKSVNLISDFHQSLGKWDSRPGAYLSSTLGRNQPNETSREAKKFLADLHLKFARVWIKIQYLAFDRHKKTVDPTTYDDYIRMWSNVCDTLLVNWQTSYEFCEEPLNYLSEDELFGLIVQSLSHYKKIASNLCYLEVENEPNCSISLPTMEERVADYEKRYLLMCKAVDVVNGMKLPGGKLKIGGPVTCSVQFDRFLPAWLEAYKNDTSRVKKIDFISYHRYANRYNRYKLPSEYSRERNDLTKYLSEKGGISEKLPLFLTETGVFVGSDTTKLGVSVDYHIQAAGMMAMHNLYINSYKIYPFHWTLEHANPRKNMFVDKSKGAIPHPYANLMKLQSMLSSTRYYSNNSIDGNGIGIGSLSSGDDNRIAMLVWNYQCENIAKTAGVRVKYKFNNLPENFKNKTLKLKEYLIPYNRESGELEIVKDNSIDFKNSNNYSSNIILMPNEVALIELSIGK